MLLLFGQMYVKFVLKCPTDLYSWFFMHFSRVLENMANSEKQRCENNLNNRYECRQGTRSRGCSVNDEKKVVIQSRDQTFSGILMDMIN